jgi:hypothetical protein
LLLYSSKPSLGVYQLAGLLLQANKFFGTIITAPSVLRYKYGGRDLLALFTPPHLLLPPLLCLLRSTAGSKNREQLSPPPPSFMPAPLLANV